MAFQQWNIRGLRSHRLNLRHLIYNYNPFIICLRETFLTYPPVPIPNYHFVSSPHSIAQSSILIHKKKTPYTSLSFQTTIPCTIFCIFLQRWITVISVYVSPSIPIAFNASKTLFSQLQPPFIITGNFNCRHTLWRDTTKTSCGWSLEHFLSITELIIFNSDHSTHFDRRTQSFSCLDLSTRSSLLRLSLFSPRPIPL